MAINITYTSQLKREILTNKTWRTTYKKQLACGVLSYAQHFGYHDIIISTIDEQVARFFAGLVPQIISLKGSITTTEVVSGGRTTYTVMVDDVIDRRNLLNFYAMLYPEGVTFDLLGGEHGTAAFIAGAFLACGSMSDPEKTYQLEFTVASVKNSHGLMDMFADVGFVPRKVERRGDIMVYFHDSQQIEDILTFLGSPRLALELMGVKILKERRNVANRMSNCDNANIDKTVIAASVQLQAIKKIYALCGETFLNDDLQQIAQLRTKYPELSLRELGGYMIPPLSRSGINHRLQRIVKIADEIAE